MLGIADSDSATATTNAGGMVHLLRCIPVLLGMMFVGELCRRIRSTAGRVGRMTAVRIDVHVAVVVVVPGERERQPSPPFFCPHRYSLVHTAVHTRRRKMNIYRVDIAPVRASAYISHIPKTAPLSTVGLGLRMAMKHER